MGSELSVRFTAGYNADGTMAQITDTVEVIAGRRDAVQPGERFLIFTSSEAYERRVASEGRAPMPGSTGALELLRLQGDEAQGFGMNPLFLRLKDLRQRLERLNDW
jgi:hypothetical protein